jgi:hypothetical protein
MGLYVLQDEVAVDDGIIETLPCAVLTGDKIRVLVIVKRGLQISHFVLGLDGIVLRKDIRGSKAELIPISVILRTTGIHAVESFLEAGWRIEQLILGDLRFGLHIQPFLAG